MNLITEELEGLIMSNPEKLKAYIALTSMMKNKNDAIEIMKNNMYQNLQESASWEEVKEQAISFAEQVLGDYPEHYDTTLNFLTKVEGLEGQAIEDYFKNDCGYFLFSDLNIAFSLTKEAMQKFDIQQLSKNKSTGR